MNRLRTTGARIASVTLLLAGLVGGVYVAQRQSADDAAAESAAATQRLVAERETQHAAARAVRDAAEADAAEKAQSVAKVAAADARSLDKAYKKAVREKKEAAKRAAESGPVPFTGKIPASCDEFSGSRQVGCALMLSAGFPIAEFPCLNKLWEKESGWNYKAENRSSGAYGIPQALPGDKMASVGADWKTSPSTQIKWGLGYIKGRYDTPCGAWSFFQSRGHY